MKTGRTIRILLGVAVCLIAVAACVFSDRKYISLSFFSLPKTTTSSDSITPGTFVTRSGSQLMLNGSPFRFAGSNMHWLGLDDSTAYPSQFRVDDGLDAAREMGASVIRAHSLGISTGCSNCIEPAPGVFNANAFMHNDYVIKAARDRNIRLVIPLTDNWHYATGGKSTFTNWRGISNEEQFYVNAQVIKDFETYISTLLNHVNTYTGVAYKDDPTIMAWETGNELDPSVEWTKTISSYIKSVDHNHLIMDGRQGVDTRIGSLSTIDIVSDHYYPMNIARLKRDADAATKAGKAFVAGEFDWNNANGGDALQNFLATIESHSAIAGDFFWELWSHDDQYGYVSNQVQYTLHYPGDSVMMRASVKQLRTHAYQMRQLAVPTERSPGTPILHVVIRGTNNNMLVWTGTALAASYTVERSTTTTQGPWITICNKCATDRSTPWMDTKAPTGASWYRVTAYNLSGVAGKPSVPYLAGSVSRLTDNLDNWSETYEHTGHLTFDTTNPVHMHGDASVVVRRQSTNESITWKQENMTSFQMNSYFWPSEPVSPFSLYTSEDGKKWILSTPQITKINGDWPMYVYTLHDLSTVNYVKVRWNNTKGHEWNPTLGMVTITY